MQKTNVEIINKLGLHARAAARFVQLASTYGCEVMLKKEHREVNGKSIMGVMMLAASQGTNLILTTVGEDETDAALALQELIANRFGEDE